MEFTQLLISYNETSLPSHSLQERFQMAGDLALGLEIANQGHVDLELYQHCGLNVTAVQAYLMHEFHPLHPKASSREQAYPHLRQTLEIAAQLVVPRVVTACGFGQVLADHPFERALDFYGTMAPLAQALGVRIMIEPLSPRRASALTDPAEIVQLLKALNQPDVFTLVLDTGHLIDSGWNLDDFFQNWNYPIEELQLKGSLSSPPQENWSVREWLSALPNLPRVLCVEHRQSIDKTSLLSLITAFKEIV